MIEFKVPARATCSHVPAVLSVPAERLFSKAGELLSIRRSRIKPKHVNMFLFLNKNILANIDKYHIV